MCVDLDVVAVGVGACWPNGNVAQQTQTVTSATSSLVQPRTGCVPPERDLGIYGDRIFRVAPLGCGRQVESWWVGGWCSIRVLPENGVEAQPCCPAVGLS